MDGLHLPVFRYTAAVDFLQQPGAQPRFQSWGVQFLGLGYYTEQNMDGIPNFVHCSVLRNGNHTLHQESWGGPSKLGGPDSPDPSGCARVSNLSRSYLEIPVAVVESSNASRLKPLARQS